MKKRLFIATTGFLLTILLFIGLLTAGVALATHLPVLVDNVFANPSEESAADVSSEETDESSEETYGSSTIANNGNESDSDNVAANPVFEAPQGLVTITISAAGDVTLGGDSRLLGYHQFMEVFERHNQDFGYFLRYIRPIFEASDLSIVNLEGTLTYATEHIYSPFVFRAPPSFARILTYGLVDVVTVANNHTWDFFEVGYQDTLDALRAEGIEYFGNNKNTIIEVNGLRVGLFGFLMWDDSPEHRGNIENAIAELQAQGAHLIIAYHHWGVMGETLAAPYQQELGQFTIDRGAHLVLGSHPHNIQGIQRYNGRFIVHSLADFCYGGHSHPDDHDSLIFQQTFTFIDGVLQNTEDINIIPIMMSSIRYYNNFQPVRANFTDASRIRERLIRYSEWIGSTLSSEMFEMPEGDEQPL
jgi:poly-gamma-glutamate synthesis protein (capsule biosynthesis protein)